MAWIVSAVLCFCPVLSSGKEAAPSPPASEIESLQREVQAIQDEYRRRIAALEDRLARLEAERARKAAPAGAGDELEALHQAARRAAGVTAGGEPHPATMAPATTEAMAGHERNLRRLNPEISVTGDLLGLSSDTEQDFDAREFELDIRSALDPFSAARWTISFGEEDVEIEEAYLVFNRLPAGLVLRAGKMRQTFGPLNRIHQHALPQVDYPLVIQDDFAPEGLGQTGISLEWLVPHPWASANELTLQITDTSSEAFGEEPSGNLSFLAHVKNFWDLSASTYLELGFSGLEGSPATGRDTRVLGADLTLHWQPPSRAKYREITWRSEYLLSSRDNLLGERQDAAGGYSYIEGLLRRNLYVGLRYDRVENPLDPDLKKWASEPYITWWLSEWVRLRAAFQTLNDDLLEDTDHRFKLEFTWAAGPHKHESY